MRYFYCAQFQVFHEVRISTVRMTDEESTQRIVYGLQIVMISSVG